MLQPREEEDLPSEEICVNEYGAVRKSENRKPSELHGSNMELLKYVSEKVGGWGKETCTAM
jgi:hypothetical protein